MKNEAFVRAMSELDDDLIAAAHEHTSKSMRKSLIVKLCAAAACVVLILGIVLVSQSKSNVDIFVSGVPPSDAPIQISTPAPMSEMQRDITPMSITVPLEIRTEDNIKISTDDGAIEVYSSDTLLYNGNLFETKGPVTVNWTVNALTQNESFKIFINETTEILLSFEKDLNNWVIIKN